MNAIRGFFVANDPQISSAVLLPTDPRKPRFDHIGHGGSSVQSLATKVLVLALFLLGLLTFAAIWLLSTFLVTGKGLPPTAIASAGAAAVVLLVAFAERRRVRRHLSRAEDEDRPHR